MEPKQNEGQIITKTTFSFTAVGHAPENRSFTFNIEADNEKDARVMLIADLTKIIQNLKD